MSVPVTIEEIAHRIKQHPRLVIAEDYEIVIQRHHTTGRKYKNGVCGVVSEDDGIWISLRLLHRKQPGRSSTTLTTPEALQQLVESTFESAKRASVDPWFRFPIWKQPKKTVPHDENTYLPDLESSFASLARPPQTVEETLENWDTETLLVRKSEKFPLQYRKRVQALQFSVFEEQDGQIFGVREERAFSKPLSQRSIWLRGLSEQCFELLRGNPADESPKRDFLFSPQVNAAVLRKLAIFFNADQVQSGRSPLAHLKDESPFSAAVTLVDDGNYLGSSQAAPFDMEGAQTQSTLLVHRGRVADFLYDTYTATRENRLSTGNFVRAPQAAHPRLGASTFYVMPSDSTRLNLVEGLGEGIFVQSFHALEPVYGKEHRFLLRGAGWKVRGGSLLEPILNLQVGIDLTTLFKSAKAVGNDLEFFGSFGSPSVLYERADDGGET